MGSTLDAIVVGGGIAGLVAARELAMSGACVRLFEAQSHLGGAVLGAKLDGVVVDLGAESFATTRTETRELIEQLGWADHIVAPRRSDARLLTPSGAVLLPHGTLGIPSDLSSDLVSAVIGADAALRAQAQDSMPPAHYDDSVTLGALVRDRMGDEVADLLVTPVVAGVHAIGPDLVEAQAVVPGLLTALVAQGSLAGAAGALRSRASGGTQAPGSAIAGLRGGMSTLIDRLVDDATDLGVDLRTNCVVQSVKRTQSGWQVTANGIDHAAPMLIMAVDAPTAAALLGDEPAVSAPLRQVQVGDVLVIALVVESAQLDADPVGSGVLVAPGHPDVAAKAMTHTSAKWQWVRDSFGPGRHLVRLSYGRDGVVTEEESQLPDIARRDIEAITGVTDVRVIDYAIKGWSRSLVHARPGHRAAVAQLRAAVGRESGLEVVGAGLGGNGLAGTIATARAVAVNR